MKRRAIAEQEMTDPDREAAVKALEEARIAREEAERLEKEEAERRQMEAAEREAGRGRRAPPAWKRKPKRSARKKTSSVRWPKPRPSGSKPRWRARRPRRKPNASVAAARKRRGKDDSRTRYGREELHVTPKSKRRKPKRKGRMTSAPTEHGFQKPTAPVKRVIDVPETITVGDLAKLMAVKAGELIKALMNMGSMVTINQPLDQETAILVVEELGHEARASDASDLESELVSADESG